MRDAPSISIITRLVQDGATVRAFDHKGMEQAKLLLPPEVVDCRALVLTTEWNEFRALSPAQLADAMHGRIVVDLRNVYEPEAMTQAGFYYVGVGRRCRINRVLRQGGLSNYRTCSAERFRTASRLASSGRLSQVLR
jgi:UDPglucose 6-dehydrogenase